MEKQILKKMLNKSFYDQYKVLYLAMYLKETRFIL